MDRENIAPIPKAGMTEENTKKKKVKEVLEYAESLTVVFAVMLLIFTFIARRPRWTASRCCPRCATARGW